MRLNKPFILTNEFIIIYLLNNLIYTINQFAGLMVKVKIKMTATSNRPTESKIKQDQYKKKNEVIKSNLTTQLTQKKCIKNIVDNNRTRIKDIINKMIEKWRDVAMGTIYHWPIIIRITIIIIIMILFVRTWSIS